jgi:hypothetical protein
MGKELVPKLESLAQSVSLLLQHDLKENTRNIFLLGIIMPYA